MVFSSITFIFYFLPGFLGIYYAFWLANGALLLGSLLFYAWGEGLFVSLLGFMVLYNFIVAGILSSEETQGSRRLLGLSIALNLGILGYFKYSAFVLGMIGDATGIKVALPAAALPLGISFFTFQLISYLIDVSRGTVPAERSFLRMFTYIAMFPHLVAGPIVRYSAIADELKKRRVRSQTLALGVQYFIIGLCQKVLIANTVAPAADKVFGLPAAELSAAIAWIGTAAYTLQIYFDFCGYSNMAIGLALLLGFHFPKNFDYPYSSRSITEFWRRWHISLSSWFRDYVYIPLGGNRHGQLNTLRNLLIVFFLTGLWHRAAWTFVVWGLFHGVFLIAERLGLGQWLLRSPEIVGRIYTLVVVMVGWVLFRSTDFAQAVSVLRAMAGFGSGTNAEPIQLWLSPEIIAAMLVGCLLSFPVVPWLLRNRGGSSPEFQFSTGQGPHAIYMPPIPTVLLLGGFILSAALLATRTLNPFLYFRF